MRIIKFATFGLITLALIWSANRLLTPKYMSGVYEGALTAEYYQSEKNHQVVFIGDCEVYENFSPITLWRDYGVTSYIRGGAQQLIWQSYYMLEDTLRYETPDIVVFNVLSMMYGTPQSEAFNRLNLDDMAFSMSKVKAVLASVTDGEDPVSYFLPLLRYHDRWKKLTSDDFTYFFRRDNVSFNGFMVRCDVLATDIIPKGLQLADYTLPGLCFEYLDKMAGLCRDKGIKLVLVKAPSIYPYWYSQWDEQITSYAAERDIMYLNFLELLDETGVDLTTDSYDGGLHLNVYGAEKLVAYLGKILTETYDLRDMRGDSQTAAAWEKKTAAYDRLKTAQELEFAAFGKILTFTYR